MVAKLSTSPCIVSSNSGVSGSSVTTVADFFSDLPPYPEVLTLMVIFPSEPGGMSLVKETAAHPQVDLTLSTAKGAVPIFLMTKS